MAIVPDRIDAVVKRFLKYSFEDINYNYELLTDEEREICSQEEFSELVKWLKGTS